MGALADISVKVAAAFSDANKLNDAVTDFSYIVVTDSYDVVTGDVTSVRDSVSSRGVATKFTSEEVQRFSLDSSNVKLLVLQNELGANPNVEDLIHGGGREWIIRKVMQDPASVTWSIALESSKEIAGFTGNGW